MGRPAWPLRPKLDGRGEDWRWKLGNLAELRAAPAALLGLLGGVGFPAADEDTAGERLVLAFDELASNALRHGQSPVVATIVAGSGGWLLDVSDRAPETMPTPAVDRDPAKGGMGLHLVARLSVAHGWYVDGGSKKRGACLPPTVQARPPALGEPDASRPPPPERGAGVSNGIDSCRSVTSWDDTGPVTAGRGQCRPSPCPGPPAGG